MGQQQLLLLVLGIVIVGIAVIVGMSSFSEGSVKTNSDALLQSALRIASEAQTWKSKPEMFAGSPDHTKNLPTDFSDLTFYELGVTAQNIVDDDCYKNPDGEYALFATSDGLGILATNVPNQNIVGVVVRGSNDSDIQLYDADWNPIKGGARPDGSHVAVRSHQRCRGRGNTPMDVSGH